MGIMGEWKRIRFKYELSKLKAYKVDVPCTAIFSHTKIIYVIHKGEIDMKKSILLLLVLVLTACTSATEVPVAAPTEVLPTATPVVLVQTVVVEATQAPTDVPPPTEVPPTAAPVVVTVVVEATQAPATQAPVLAPADTTNGLITVDNVLGAGYFTDMTRTGSQLSLRCQLYKEIKFSVKPIEKNITQVLFYYRIQDRSTGGVFEWQNAGKMVSEADGTFTLVFNGEQVNADSRRPNAWLDYQFVGLSKTGDPVGRSEKIEKQITYTFECP